MFGRGRVGGYGSEELCGGMYFYVVLVALLLFIFFGVGLGWLLWCKNE